VRVGFLGLRVLITCFNGYLDQEWHHIARTIRYTLIPIMFKNRYFQN
jgi:hypothetical protein